ncbi:MAG TPA: FAD-dependent oxidoreductase [Thermoanaerobaculia bacterium]
MTQRTFLGFLSAAPLTTRLDASILFATVPPHVAVIGAGSFGSWTALQLHRMGARVTLIDAWGPGNLRSSSGGDTRVIRAVYGRDRIYVEMVKRAFELWLELDASVEESLYVETGALWMNHGDDGYVRSSLPILEELGFPADEITPSEAARRYPQIRLEGIKSLWMERRAGVLSARRACMAVRDLFAKSGGTYRTANVEPGEISGSAMSSVRLSDGTILAADFFVFACGPWLGKLFPSLPGDLIRPTRQEVHYFGVPGGSSRYGPEQLPVWIDFGERVIYGIPDVHGRGFKLADDTRGEWIDPTSADRLPSSCSIARARAFLAGRFPELADAPLLESRVCQYENSPDGQLIIDRHPEAENVWLAGGGSGHGFKLGPAVGEITAECIVSGVSAPEPFRLARFRREIRASTQFESR